MKNIIFIIFASFIVLLYALLWHISSFHFPVPWIDEAHFLWQSINFAEENTLLAPQLNSDRDIMWMPPGFMVFYGIVFKAVPFSLQAARVIVLTTTILSIILLLKIISKNSRLWVAATAGCLFFLGPPFIFLGNMARMESLLLLIVIGGYFFLQQKKAHLASALFLISPLIHPNGLFFLVGGCLHSILIWKQNNIKNNMKFLVLVFPLVLWSLYIFYIISNWEGFISDMNYQFSRKINNNNPLRATETFHIISFIILIGIYGLAKKTPTTFLSLMAIPFFMVQRIAFEMCYGIFDSIYFILFLSVIGESIIKHTNNNNNKHSIGRRIFFCFLVGIIITFTSTQLSGSLPVSITKKEVNYWQMGMFGGDKYIKTEDINKVVATITSTSKKLTVQFYPAGNSLFFEKWKGRFNISQPLFSEQIPDIFIIHISKYHPKWWKYRLEEILLKADKYNKNNVFIIVPDTWIMLY